MRARLGSGTVPATSDRPAVWAIDDEVIHLREWATDTVHPLIQDARGAILDGATAASARLSRVNLAGASMRGMDLQAAIARDCDLSDANLTRVRWHGGAAIRCSFAGAELLDLAADRTVFLDCDLQGADLSAGEQGARATLAGAQFLRCDLRWSRWEHRALAGVRFVGCQLHGMLGVPRPGDEEAS